MTYYYNIELDFERDFEAFLINRMYPPGYGKESAMIKLSMEHVNAVVHAELAIDNAIEVVSCKRVRDSFEKDQLRLAELKLYVIQKMTEPQLPFKKADEHTRDDFLKKDKPDGDTHTNPPY